MSFLPVLKFREMQMENPYIRFPNAPDIPRVDQSVSKKIKLKSPQTQQNIPSQINLISGCQPFFVSERQEINAQAFILQKKKRKKRLPDGKRIDNQLEANFPIHNDFNFVEAHALGFKGKQNIDLFQFYYRLYKKNKFFIQKLRKQKKERLQQKEQLEIKLNEELKDKKKEIRQSIILNKQMNNPENKRTQQVKIQEMVIQKGLEELNNIEALLMVGQQKLNQTETKAISNNNVANKRNNNSYSTLPVIARQKQVNVCNLEAQSYKFQASRSVQELQTLEMQQLFMNRIIESIKSRGFESVPSEDVKQLKSIINKRKEQLTEMQATVNLQFLLKVKNKMYQNELLTKQQAELQYILEQEQKIKEQETLKQQTIDLSSIQHSFSGYQHGQYGNQRPNLSIYEFKFLDYEDQSINNSIFLKKPQNLIPLENINQELSIINPDNSQSIQQNQNGSFLSPSPNQAIDEKVSEVHEKVEVKSQNSKQRKSPDQERSSQQNEQEQEEEIQGKKQKKVKKKKIIKVKKKKVKEPLVQQQNEVIQPKEKKKKIKKESQDQGNENEQEDEDEIEQDEEEQVNEKDVIQQQNEEGNEEESEYEEIEVEDDEYEYYYDSDQEKMEENKENANQVDDEIYNDDDSLLQYDQQASDIIEQLLQQQDSTAVQEESLISYIIEDSNNATTFLREKLEKANIPAHIIEKKLKIMQDQQKKFKQQEKSVSQQDFTTFLKKQLAPAKFKQILVENEHEIENDIKDSPNKKKVDEDMAEFYNQHRENLMEGKIIKEIRELQSQQEIELNRQKARLIRKQTSNVNKTLSSNEDYSIQDERAKGKFKKNEFGQKISDKEMLKQYRQKEAIIDQEKFQENLKKMNEMSQDQKKMMLEAFQVKLQNQENKEELDEELNFLQSIVNEHKSQKTQILQQFQDELLQKRAQKQQQQQQQLSKQKKKNQPSQIIVDESKSEQLQLNSPAQLEELLSERNKKQQNLNDDEDEDQEEEDNNHLKVSKIQRKQPKQKQFQKQVQNQSIKSLRNIDEKKQQVNRAIKSTSKISVEKSDENYENENMQSSSNLPKQLGLIHDEEQENDSKSVQSYQSHKTKYSSNSFHPERSDDKFKEKDLSKFHQARRDIDKNEEEEDDEEEVEEVEDDSEQDDSEEKLVQEKIVNEIDEDEDSEVQSGEIQMKQRIKKKAKKHTISDTPSRSSQKNLPVQASKIHPKKKKKKKKNQKVVEGDEEEEDDEVQISSKPNYSVENLSKKALKQQNLNDLINEKLNDQNQQIMSRKTKNKLKTDSDEELENELTTKKREVPRGIKKVQEVSKEIVQKKKRRETTEMQSDDQTNEEDEDKQNQKKSTIRKGKVQQKKKVNKKDELAEQQLLQQQLLEQELLKKEAEKKKFNLKDELETMKKRNLSLRELKNEIENKIQNIDTKDATDETKYNIYLYLERQKQMKNFSGHLEEIIQDALERMPECSDVIKVFYEARSKYKDVAEKDKELKFSNQIKIEEVETKEAPAVDLTNVMDDIQYKIQRMLQMAQQGILRETSQERKELFQFDSELLKKLKEIYRQQTVVQTSIEQTQSQVPNESELMKENFQSSLVSIEISESKDNNSTIEDTKLKILAQKLKKIKKSNKTKFNDIISRSREIQYVDYLSTTPYKDLAK